VPRTTIGEIAPTEHAQLVAEVRRARQGSVPAIHIVLLCAAQRSPTAIAAGLFCSRPSVYRVVQAYRAGHWESWAEGEGPGEKGLRPRPVLAPARKWSVLGILKRAPRLCGWGRTRWSCATVALELCGRRRIPVSGETVRRWLHELGGEGKRATLRAKADDPERVEQWARIGVACEQLRAGAALCFAAEVDSNLLPQVGYHWRPKGEQAEVLTPGTNEKRYLAGALEMTTGTITQCVWSRKRTGRFLELRDTLDRTHPAPFSRSSPWSSTMPSCTRPSESNRG
jgi:transposase